MFFMFAAITASLAICSHDVLFHFHTPFSVFSLYTKMNARLFLGTGFEQVFEQQ